MGSFLTILEIVLSIALISLVLIQAKGAGLGSAFGGSGEAFRSKRGVEKIVTWGAGVVAILFAVNSILLLIIK
jgi:preprotein translocase subunit SecG